MAEEPDGQYETFPGIEIRRPPSKCRRALNFLTSNRFLLYVCCFITSWGDRMWYFAIGVYMIALYPQSLELTAIYGFLNSAGSLIFGAIIGDLIDKTQRLNAVRVALVVRNLSIFSCSAAVFFTFTFWKDIDGTWILDFSKAGIIFLAVLAHLASIANNITVTKDWVVVVCNEDNAKLAEMSAFFRRIDLFCKILSPVVVGQIMSFTTNEISAIFICCENIITLIVMYTILRTVYRRVPRLAVKSDILVSSDSEDQGSPGDKRMVRKPRTQRWGRRLCTSCLSLYKGWRCYVRHPVCSAGVSLAMMYMTVLGFDNITVGYAYSQGLTPSVLSWIMAGAGVTGIIGTLLFLPMRRRFGLPVTGILSFCIDLLFLQLCVWAVFTPGSVFLKPPGPANTTAVPIQANNSDWLDLSNATAGNSSAPDSGGGGLTPVNVSIILLMAGIVLSRIGLWLVDLTVTQLMLETVEEKERGKVNGVQYSLNMFLDLLKFLLVIIIPQPEYFGFLILLSFVFIVIGLLVNVYYGAKNNFKDPTTAAAANANASAPSGETKGEAMPMIRSDRRRDADSDAIDGDT